MLVLHLELHLWRWRWVIFIDLGNVSMRGVTGAGGDGFMITRVYGRSIHNPGLRMFIRKYHRV